MQFIPLMSLKLSKLIQSTYGLGKLMGEKKITDKIAEAAKTIFDTAKSVATSDETKAAFASAKETISRAVKSHGKNEANSENSDEKKSEAENQEVDKKENSSEVDASAEKQESKSEEGSSEEETKK